MIDINKKYTTRDGRAVRILCVDAPGRYPVVGYIQLDNNTVVPTSWTTGGDNHNPGLAGKYDLVLAKTKHEGWVNIYRSGNQYTTLHNTMDEANQHAASDRIACVKVEWEE